ncbi:hypothetical protein [uncultured Methanoregula sp.]|uniref:hypothetical protein n=1 Tax=uncultured Methanoregula sp. TaxID=1005933 RepID=UPI002AAA9E6B|nr:hypothetical protein [uncultured Methanoregula sp.]
MTHYLTLLVAAGIAALVLVAGCTVTQPAGPVTTEKTTVPATEQTFAKPLKPTPATLPRISVPEGSIAQYYTYTLNGKSDVIPLALSTSVYQDYTKKAEPSIKNGNSAYFLGYVNDPEQQPYIAALARAIQEKTSVQDDQARIAISLVQHIPYRDGSQYRFPYEVLYSGQGVCGEKSLLLASLLQKLGYGSAVFYFVKEDHMTTGIAAPSAYDYRGTGYAFIEATEPNIITYDGSEFSFGTLASVPEVIIVGTGRSLSTVSSEYQDARTYTTIEGDINHLSTTESAKLDSLDAKYDLSYYTCQTCKIPKVA